MAARPCPIRPRSRQARAARDTTPTCAPVRSGPTTGTGARGSSAAIRPTSSSCSRRAPPTARKTRSWEPYTPPQDPLGAARQLQVRATKGGTSRAGWVLDVYAMKALPPEDGPTMWGDYTPERRG